MTDRMPEQVTSIAMELGRLRDVCAQLEQEVAGLRMELEAMKNRRCRQCGAVA